MKRKHTTTLGKWITYWLYTWVIIAISTIFVMVFVLKPVQSFHRADQQGAPLSISLTRSPTSPTPAPTPTPTPELIGSQTGDWTTYMADNGRSSFNAVETIITPATAPELKLKWTHQAGDAVVSQPVVVNGLIYWASWDGYEYATTLDNRTVWATYLGRTVADPSCIPPQLGVTSTATIANVNINGTLTSADFLGGGNGYFYALNALTGTIIWKTFLGSPPGYYLWSSPAFYQGHIYMGVSSLGDCPLVPGRVVQLDPATGMIQHVFNTVPNGCRGGGVWSSPVIDETTGTVYISTGTKGPCATPELGKLDIHSLAILELRASDLSLLQFWQIPKSERIHDGDFGATPTLFTTSTSVPMVGVANKNGTYYAFKRDDLSAPVWRAVLSTGHLGHGVISSSAWDGHRLYVGARTMIINGVLCKESMVALDPDTGTILWRQCFKRRALIGAIVAVPGLVVLGQAGYVFVLDANSGQTLFAYGHDTGDNYSLFRGWATISHGVLYIGGTDGKLYAFAP
jgi:polyvinyl alcohol dehydrogenase (cytochrome)